MTSTIRGFTVAALLAGVASVPVSLAQRRGVPPGPTLMEVADRTQVSLSANEGECRSQVSQQDFDLCLSPDRGAQELAAPSEAAEPPAHLHRLVSRMSFRREAADGSWSQLCDRDTFDDGCVELSVGPVMDEFTMPPSPGVIGFFDGASQPTEIGALERPRYLDDPSLPLNQGVSYEVPGRVEAGETTDLNAVGGPAYPFTREHFGGPQDMFDIRCRSTPVVPLTIDWGTPFPAPVTPPGGYLNQGVSYRPPPDQEVGLRQFDANGNRVVDNAGQGTISNLLGAYYEIAVESE